MKSSKYFLHLIIIIFTTLILGCKNDKKLIAKANVFSIKTTEITDSDSLKLSQQYIDSMSILIDKFYKKNWTNNTMNGGLIVAKNGQIIYEKYNGYANLSARTLISESTPIHIASVSKVITATAILKLVEQKRLDLDQKVNTILGSFPYPNVTIRTLLNHRSGIKNYTHFTYDKKVWNYKKIITNQDILNLLIKKRIPLERKTNTHFAYCNTNYALLALVIEKTTGLSYADAMKEMFFDPLEMKNSFVFNYNTDLETATPSYKKNNQKYGMEYLDAVYGDKNIYSTPRDLLKFDIARQSKGFLSPELDKQIYQGYSYESKGTKNYGLGMRMIEWETGQRYYFHNGWWHGNTASFISLPKDKLSIICLSNKYNIDNYKVKRLSMLFGDYPFKIDDEE